MAGEPGPRQRGNTETASLTPFTSHFRSPDTERAFAVDQAPAAARVVALALALLGVIYPLYIVSDFTTPWPDERLRIFFLVTRLVVPLACGAAIWLMLKRPTPAMVDAGARLLYASLTTVLAIVMLWHPAVGVNGMALIMAGATILSVLYWVRWNFIGYVAANLLLSLAWIIRVAPGMPDAELIWSCCFLATGVLAGFVVLRLVNGATRIGFHRLLQVRLLNAELDARVAARTRDLEQAKIAAEMANQAKSRFLANMSHELRTPLNAVLGFSEVMMTEILGPIGSARYREYAADIHRSGSHLLDLVNDVLDLSRLEQGMVELREERVALAPFVADTMRLVAMPAQTAAIELAVHLPDEAPDLLVDTRALRQVLVNLLANAIKFTGPGGAVTLSASKTASGGLDFTVGDTGQGIPEDRLQAIFEPFHQVDPQIANPGHGVGLGLAIARALVEAHGGSIRVASEVCVGSVFTVTLPPQRLLAPRFYRRA